MSDNLPPSGQNTSTKVKGTLKIDPEKWQQWLKEREAQKLSLKKSEPKPAEQTGRRRPAPAVDATTPEADEFNGELSALAGHLQCDLIREAPQQRDRSSKKTEPASGPVPKPKPND